jgi:hypothetical protein
VVIRDHEDTVADPRAPGRRRDRLLARKRVPALALGGQVGEIGNAEERRTGNVLGEIRLEPGLDAFERVAAVDELVPDQ